MAHDDERDLRLRALPAVTGLLEQTKVKDLVAAHGRTLVLSAVRRALADARAALLAGKEAGDLQEAVAKYVAAEAASSLRRVVNATGVVVHTNLGRAPLAPEAIAAMAEAARGYVSLEVDLETGKRGERSVHAVDLLRALTGAEDALVVNNGAAAVLLALAALAVGREVVVSRGELVEIGGGFRIPDVLRQSGARLVEVGTTNRTHPADYEAAIGEHTALLMKVHRSNFAVVGFTREVALPELASLAHARGLPLVYDAGSGAIAKTEAGEEPVAAAVAAGADLVTFSGDKLLGGPQAGVVVGKRDLVLRMRKHPLMRALRPDKTCFAALAATLRLWRDAPARIPVVHMIQAPLASLEARADAIARALVAEGLSAEVVATTSRVGGGAAPTRELESRAVRIEVADADDFSARLREHTTPVVARIDEGAVLLDVRTVDPRDDELVRDAAVSVRSR